MVTFLCLFVNYIDHIRAICVFVLFTIGIMLCYVYGEFLYDVSSCALADSLFVLLCFCASVRVWVCMHSLKVKLYVIVQHAICWSDFNWPWHIEDDTRADSIIHSYFLSINFEEMLQKHTQSRHIHTFQFLYADTQSHTHTYNWFLRFSVFLIHIHGKYLHSHRHTRLAYDFPYDFE